MTPAARITPMALPRRTAAAAPARMAGYLPTRHCARQAASKGIPLMDVLQAANAPTTRYESRRGTGQWRHIRGSIVAVVDPIALEIITVYANVVETDLRPDQQDADAAAYGQRRSH
jgi:hypothetical protein